MDRAEIERVARKRVAAKMGFVVHALVFVVVNAGLLALNLARGGPMWSAWPMAGWGLGLALHGLGTYLSLDGAGLRERMVQREIDELQRRASSQ